ncbi:MAG: polysaccharide deacetylase family protein (PEP-CTERM system associated) [Planctomycetota bacterium]|jgi:polysaccharide deacetylase family protein (PEP-CTERM system associated)
MTRPLHALSFDVEEFFQVANLRHRFEESDWDETPSRLDIGMDAILGALDRHDSKATFFFLGWVAERRPDLVRRCVDGGHEVASHGYRHLFLGDLGPEGLDKDLAKTEEVLVAAGAPSPKGFRASTFTLTRETFWAVDILIKRGYAYDSSIHPVRHPTYGIPDFEPDISTIKTAAGSIVEFPVATYPFRGRNLPMGGGGYFRLLPGVVTRAALSSLEKKGRHASIYLHPWEFDPKQPRQPAPLLKRFRHYVGLKRTLPRMERLLERFRFGTMAEVLRESGHLS